jgi:Arc/MetJ-type ribon-helix-helix transcriptional regulator
MTRKEMIRDLVYNDVYGDRDEFLKRILRHGWLGYENWEDAALTEACKMFRLIEEVQDETAQ